MDKMKNTQEPRNLVELARYLNAHNIPENEHKPYFDRFLENRARDKRIPLTGSFELTPVCNLDCKMCYVHLDHTQFNPENLLSVEKWTRIIQQAYQAGMRNASITGGECLTYPGFDEVYLHFHNLGITPCLLSNGILIDKKIDLLKKYPPKMIQISLYGSSEDAYQRVTGHRVFSKVYENINLLHNYGLPVKLTITPNEFMKEDILPLLELAGRIGIQTNINANLIPPRENTGRVTHDLSVDDYVEIFKTQSRIRNKEPVPIDAVELPDENHGNAKEYGLLCGAGRSSFGLKYDGSMCPCLSLGDIFVDTLSLGFEEAWKQINTIANNYPLPLECGGCIYRDRCLPCIAMHQNAPQKGHCDPRICERTKKLMAAGFIPLPEKE